MPVALITGGSAGLGLALTTSLAGDGWTVITDGRHAERLAAATARLGDGVVAIQGDVADPDHRAVLVREVERLGRLDLLVHNASTLGPLPLGPLQDLELEQLRSVWTTNTGAPFELSRAMLPRLRADGGILLSLSSDAAVEHYEGWGPYGASKAALDHLVLTFAAETGVTAYTLDPGEMRTAMHQDAFPGEDISDRPLPESVVPHLRALLTERPPSGRYRAADVAVPLAERA